MKRQTSEWAVTMLAALRGRINIEAEYQRGEVWSESQQQLLIDSILRGFDLPKIFLRRLPDGSDLLFDVVDGVQRLTSIWRFLADEFSLPRHYSYPDLGDVGGKSWSQLPQAAKDRLELTKVTVSEIETEDEYEIRDLFQRLQKGEPLNAAERRNAISGPVRNFVADELAIHSFWPKTGLKEKRFGWHEMSAIALALVKAKGATGLKAADLFTLYEDQSFDPQGETAELTKDLLGSLEAVVDKEPKLIRTRWGLVDLLLSIMQLRTKGTVPLVDEIIGFFKIFEDERRMGTAELSDLRATVIDLASDKITEEEIEPLAIKPDMLTYLNAFTHEGASEKNVKTRAEVMTNRLYQYLQEAP